MQDVKNGRKGGSDLKLKRFLAGVGTLCLVLSLLLPLQVHAQGSTGSTTIKTTVPDTHIVLLDIGEHGSVLINDKVCTSEDKQVEVARLAEQTYIIQPDKGWQIESVWYGQMDAQETVKLSEDTFTAPAIYSDENKLTVTFRKSSAGGGTDTDGTGTEGTDTEGKDTEGTDTEGKDAEGTADKDGQSAAQTGTGVKTGDTFRLIMWLPLLGISGVTALILRRKKMADKANGKRK